MILRTREQADEAILPLAYAFEEQRGRRHRVIIIAPHELFTLQDMRFVGFVSRQNPLVERHIVDAIIHTDELMLDEITRIPGLLSYSSLELHPGVWYNLVLFRDSSIKIHVKSVEVHRHAAHQLSPAYYTWIRLHNGTLLGGLNCPEWHLKQTRYYRFTGAGHPPTTRELNYETHTDAC